MGGVLQDKVVVVTGGTRGVGRGVALAALHEGARVAVGDRDRQAGQDLIAAVEAQDLERLFFAQADVQQVDSVVV